MIRCPTMEEDEALGHTRSLGADESPTEKLGPLSRKRFYLHKRAGGLATSQAPCSVWVAFTSGI